MVEQASHLLRPARGRFYREVSGHLPLAQAVEARRRERATAGRQKKAVSLRPGL